MPTGIVDRLAESRIGGDRLSLGLGSRPLGEAQAVMPAGVPGPRAHPHLPVGAVDAQIIADEGGGDPGGAGVHPVQEGQIEGAPEVRTLGHVPEPAAVLAVGAGGHQGREVTPLGALRHLGEEPAHLHAGLLGIGEIPIPYDDGDAVIAIACHVGAISQLLPAHRADGLHVLAIHQDIAISELPQERDQLHGEAHLGGPEALKGGAPQQMVANTEPALKVLLAIRLGDQGQDGMVIAGPQNLE